MSEWHWHGWSRGDNIALYIGRLPGRKSICLYTVEGSVLRTHAFFKNEEDAKEVLQLLDHLIGGEDRE